ncbi:MAG: NAD(P)-dependent oxidoreductase [Halioglobus sp.]|nr:NAD(P)-dependent oxidoreductase [Halioglobus sp.]
MTAKANVGYIGLGNIGKPSAERLITDQLAVHVFDVFQPAVDELVEKGATGCQSVAELAGKCVHIGICVRDDQQVEELLYGEGGVLANAAKGSIVAIHSTVTQASVLKWAEEAGEKGIHLLDAPITGGAHRAAEGTLCYMVGGDKEIVERCRPVFMTSAEKVVHAGSLGSGIALKLCNNFIQYTEFVAMAEATRLAEACGLSVDVLREVGLSNGVVNEQMHMFVSGRNGLARSCSEEEMEQFFGALGALGRKDLQCALDTAADHGVVLPTAVYVRDRIENVFLARDESRPPRQDMPHQN